MDEEVEKIIAAIEAKNAALDREIARLDETMELIADDKRVGDLVMHLKQLPELNEWVQAFTPASTSDVEPLFVGRRASGLVVFSRDVFDGASSPEDIADLIAILSVFDPGARFGFIADGDLGRAHFYWDWCGPEHEMAALYVSSLPAWAGDEWIGPRSRDWADHSGDLPDLDPDIKF